jgi:hypothetical protein
MQRRTEIIIETERFMTVSRRCDTRLHWCEQCAMNVPMLAVDEDAPSRSWVESGRFHFARTAEGRLFICFNSLVSESARKNTL